MASNETSGHRVKCVRCEETFHRNYGLGVKRITYFLCAQYNRGSEIAKDQNDMTVDPE